MQRVVELPPGARARGRAHGEALRELIRGHLDALMRNLDAGRATEPRAYLQELLDGTDFLPAIRRETPQLLEEVEGLAEGAGLPFRDVFALQLLDEEWAFSARRRAAPRARDKCSAFAFADAAGALVGQNMDLGVYTDGFQVLLRCAESDGEPPQQIFTLAGIIGLMGANAAGVGICVNTLAQLPDANSGLPVAFVLRGAIACGTARDSADFIGRVRHASGQHYVVADPKRVVSLEASAGGVATFAGEANGCVLHTNHPLIPGPSTDAWRAQAPNSVARLASLRARLGVGPLTIEAARAALSSRDDPEHPVCRTASPQRGLINFTTGSMISSLRRDVQPVVSEVSFGPPVGSPWHTFTLDAWRHAA